jgi:hypothetical protein
MTTSELPTQLRELPADARFVCMPATIGAGQLFVAGTSGGCVAIAPPFTSLCAGESVESRVRWRFGWFAADAYGADLDSPPEEVSELCFEAVWSVGQLSEHAELLRQNFIAYARHLVSVGQWLSGEHLCGVNRDLAVMREEWSKTFPGAPWPL